MIPKYPEICRTAGVEGKVTIEFYVDETGKIDQSSISILQSIPCLDQVCLDVIKKSITNFTVINQETEMYVDAWMNINPKGAGNEKHTHPSCALAGVIWLKIPENSGNLFFYSPFGHIGIDEIMAYDQDFANSFHIPHTAFTKPEEGKMLIFSSHLFLFQYCHLFS